MSEGAVRYERHGNIARITFDRPEARNAMTWRMYDELREACERVMAEHDLRAVVFRGAGGKAFVAGTDIGQFREFKSPEDGVAYERRIEPCFAQIEALPMPTLAVIEGWAVGGGLAIAAACDLRIATPSSRFGVPIARTIGNCLSMENHARLVAGFGVARTNRMLMLAELLSAEEALAAGFLAAVVPPSELEDKVSEFCKRLSGNAPVTLRVTKEALRRLRASGLPGDEDLIRQCYGSQDFRIGVEAFVRKQEPGWTGR